MNRPIIELRVSLETRELLQMGNILTRMGNALSEDEPVDEPGHPTSAGIDLIKGTPALASPLEPTAPVVPLVPVVPTAPAAPLVPVVPTAPAAPNNKYEPAAPQGSAAETDASGMPWDARIHAGTKTKKQDGNWKARKGVEKKYFASVVAEIRPAVAATPPSGGASQADKNVVFMNLMQKVTGLTTPPAGTTVPKVTIEAITAIVVKHGAANIPALLQGPIETINAVAKEVDTLCLTLV